MIENSLLRKVEAFGNILVTSFHLLALFVIGGSIVWSAVYTYLEIMQQGYAHLIDILLLFIYLELGAMVGIYFKTHRLPVRFLVYVAITALTRLLTIEVKEMSSEGILSVAGAIFMLSLAALALQYGAVKLSTADSDD
ncbi:MAG: phosphate-starvation-inducible PsiE family protein [Gammaproteobacteria bacterium]|nr:phosphate-starvation-inducible PsiE family protein [Gammaproteobacteria bacterium]